MSFAGVCGASEQTCASKELVVDQEAKSFQDSEPHDNPNKTSIIDTSSKKGSVMVDTMQEGINESDDGDEDASKQYIDEYGEKKIAGGTSCKLPAEPVQPEKPHDEGDPAIKNKMSEKHASVISEDPAELEESIALPTETNARNETGIMVAWDTKLPHENTNVTLQNVHAKSQMNLQECPHEGLIEDSLQVDLNGEESKNLNKKHEEIDKVHKSPSNDNKAIEMEQGSLSDEQNFQKSSVQHTQIGMHCSIMCQYKTISCNECCECLYMHGAYVSTLLFCITKFITNKTFSITAISEREPKLFTESPEPSQLMIYADQLECKWEELGQALRLPTDCLNSMSTMPDGTKFCSRVIETWAEKKTTPYTWDTLLYALKAIGEDKIADEILGIYIYIYI